MPGCSGVAGDGYAVRFGRPAGRSGYSYDAFGRTTKLPGTEAVEYYANDLVRAIRKSAADVQTWTLDAELRLASSTRTTTTGGVTTSTVTRNGYANASDSPAWISDTVGSGAAQITRYVPGMDGNLAATTTPTGGLRVQVTNLHGDVAVTFDPSGTQPETDRVLDADEYGVVRGPAARYGWLGGRQRSAETPTGVILMGVRLYAPTLGRFLSVDPVPGGNDNPYVYAADPINMYDLDGRWGWFKSAAQAVWNHRETIINVVSVAAMFVPVAAPFVAVAWAWRAHKVVKALHAGRKFIHASRPTAWLAGRMHVGWRGVRKTPKWNGKGVWRRKNDNHYRNAGWKKNRKRYESNIERYQKGHHQHRNLHIVHRWRWW